MKIIQRIIVAAILLSKDNKLLLGMKDPNGGGVYADCWHIPGGGIEASEDKLFALKREVFEEVGIDIEGANIELVNDQDTGESIKALPDGEKVICQMHFNVYRVNLRQNAEEINVVLNDDLVKAEWVEISELSNYKLTPPSVKLFSKLGWCTEQGTIT